MDWIYMYVLLLWPPSRSVILSALVDCPLRTRLVCVFGWWMDVSRMGGLWVNFGGLAGGWNDGQRSVFVCNFIVCFRKVFIL